MLPLYIHLISNE